VNRRACDYVGCQSPAVPYRFVYGSAYCEEHYLLGLEHALFEERPSVIAGNPSIKFRNVFGRYVEQVYSSKGIPIPEQLASTKLRDRAEGISYHDNGISFVIHRHPEPIPVCQRWYFDLREKALTLIDESPIYLGCREAARRLKCSRATVRHYIAQGKIHAKKPSEIPEVSDWFDDKLERGDYVTYSRRNLIIPHNKWLIPTKELDRFVKEG
jgi:hypothetical protein